VTLGSVGEWSPGRAFPAWAGRGSG
jgi:hypothetical protein